MEFGESLYKTIISQDQHLVEKNFVCGPGSIYIALALVLAGSDGTTRTQLLQSLNLPLGLDAASVIKRTEAVIKAFDKKGDDQLLSANRIFLDEKFPVLEEYLKLVGEHYQAEATNLPVSTKPDEARATINEWVSNRTNEKILELLPPGSLTPLTVAILVNAMYFKASWQESFRKERTRVADFFQLDGTRLTKVEFMFAKRKLAYARSEELKVSIVKLPFKEKEGGAKFSFCVILPDKQDGLKDLFHQTGHFWAKNQYQFTTQTVNLSLPKMRIQSTVDLVAVLKQLGLTDMFSETADFSQLSPKHSLKIDGAFHQAVIEVDEEGAVAAAATGMAVNSRSMEMTVDFNADHPFLYMILDGEDSPLFIGHFSTQS